MYRNYYPIASVQKKQVSLFINVTYTNHQYFLSWECFSAWMCVSYVSPAQQRFNKWVHGDFSFGGCAHHLACHRLRIANMTIEDHVIDNEAWAILSHVRLKLGLPAGALIIPSNMHDYLVDQKQLHQEKCVGVCGGNMLDPVHVGNFWKVFGR
jgi:hypothetical protein